MDFPPPPPPSYTSTVMSAEQHPYTSPTSPGRHTAFPGPTGAPPQLDSDGNVVSEHIDTAKYKTKMCTNFSMGVACSFGNRCAFAHGQRELRPNAPPGPPSYQEFSASPSTPRSAGPQVGYSYGDAAPPPPPATATMLSPTKVHPRSVPGSPVAADVGGYPVVRFRNNPYSVEGFDEMEQQEEAKRQEN